MVRAMKRDAADHAQQQQAEQRDDAGRGRDADVAAAGANGDGMEDRDEADERQRRDDDRPDDRQVVALADIAPAPRVEPEQREYDQRSPGPRHRNVPSRSSS